jgi:hypothetical protein
MDSSLAALRASVGKRKKEKKVLIFMCKPTLSVELSSPTSRVNYAMTQILGCTSAERLMVLSRRCNANKKLLSRE